MALASGTQAGILVPGVFANEELALLLLLFALLLYGDVLLLV